MMTPPDRSRTTTPPRRGLDRSGKAALALVALTALAYTTACTHDIASSITAPRSSTRVQSDNATSVTEAAAMTELTRGIARALGSADVRRALHADLAETGLGREAKLDGRSHLNGLRGGALVRAVTQATGMPRDSVLKLVAAVRPFEMYLPVRSQRLRWNDEPVIVASTLGKSDPLVAFDGSGSEVSLDPKKAPATTVVALVPVESNFATMHHDARAISSLHGTRHDMLSDDPCAGSSTMITLPPECEGGGSGGGWSTATVPAAASSGLYMVYSNLYDAMEPWIRGDPEVEAHVLGALPNQTPNTTNSISCASESGVGPNYFDQNDNTWRGYVRLLSADEFAQNKFVNGMPDGRTFYVGLWEDDDTRCVIKDDPYRLSNILFQYGVLGGGVWATAGSTGPDGAIIASLVYIGVAAVEVTYALFQTNDDFLGLAVPKADIGYNDPAATHGLLLGTDGALNGGIRLVYHTQGTDTY